MAVARGVRIDRIGFDGRRSLLLCVVDRGSDYLVGKALAAECPPRVHADDRPDVFVFFRFRSAQLAIGVARRDRYPGEGFALEVADEADGGAGIDAAKHLLPARRARGVLGLRAGLPPGHAPAVFGAARSVEDL